MKFTRQVPPNKLYNAGDRISERLSYSLPDGHDIHCVGHWQLEAPERDFFTIPEVFFLKNGQGEDVPIYPRFTETVLRPDRFGQRGVVLIDPEYKPGEDEDTSIEPISDTADGAIRKAKRILEGYEKGIVQLYIDQCNLIRQQGGVPVAAAGYTKRLLKKYGIADPSEAVLMKADDQTKTIQELQKTLADQQKMIEQLAANGGALARTPAKERRASR